MADVFLGGGFLQIHYNTGPYITASTTVRVLIDFPALGRVI